MGDPGCRCVSLDVSRCLWVSLVVSGCLWVSLSLHGEIGVKIQIVPQGQLLTTYPIVGPRAKLTRSQKSCSYCEFWNIY